MLLPPEPVLVEMPAGEVIHIVDANLLASLHEEIRPVPMATGFLLGTVAGLVVQIQLLGGIRLNEISKISGIKTVHTRTIRMEWPRMNERMRWSRSPMRSIHRPSISPGGPTNISASYLTKIL